MIPTIDSQFKALIPPLSAEERDQLEHNIMESRIAFGVREMEFCNRDDAMVWIIENQLGRRNIPDAT
ncbi:MAG: hypothetical protein FWF78_01795, partial [Defluviitaleaceae bacterium]|nr:hypothetical protein [Defluviitaleaceae bacterium]